MTTHNLKIVNEHPGIVYQCQGHRIDEITQTFYQK